jgi:hypothetical protein
MVSEHAQRVKPPRVLAVPFPFGYALGRADDPEQQHQVLKAALDLLERNEGPVLEEFADDAEPEFLLQSSTATKLPDSGSTSASLSPADELTALRAYYERWVEAHDGRTAVGLTGIPQRRFRGVIRFLEAYVSGEDTDTPDRPPEVPVVQFIRYCVDDLKAFYYEARMAQRPDHDGNEVHQWFWGETALAALVAKLSGRIGESDDPHLKSIAYGLAR